MKRFDGASGLFGSTVAALLLVTCSACSSSNGDGSDGGNPGPTEAGSRTDATATDAGASDAPHDDSGSTSTDGAAPSPACDAAPSTAPWPDAGGPLDTTVLGTGSYSSYGHTWTYQLLRLANAAGGYAYAEWMPRLSAGPGPVVVVTVPYDGIDWTGETVDQVWASRPNAATGYSYPDVNGPDGSTSSPSIAYRLVSPQAELSSLAFPHDLNDMSVLLLYGRFYAGGTLDTYVGAMQAGMRFLATAPQVDPARVGVFGASWGGFEAAYTAAYASPGVVPAVAVPMSPVLDFSVLTTHVTTDLDASVPASALGTFQTFYDPYLRRIFAATGGPPAATGSDYSHFDGAALCARLRTSLLVPQDDWDTIIPVGEARAFVQSCPCHASGLWYQHTAPAPPITSPTHGPMAQGVTYTNDAGAQMTGLASVLTFSFAYMNAHLLPASSTALLPYGEPDVLAFLQSVHDWQKAGLDVSFVAPRLADVAQPNVQAYDLTGMATSPQTGAQVVADAMARVWPSAGITASNVLAMLQSSGLPPP